MPIQWKSGDFVRFVLGGPVMLVKTIDVPDPAFLQQVTCQWFTDDGQFQEFRFLPEHLVPAKAPKSTKKNKNKR